MRILTVSAHYPPNFTSGGTLQPQRMARGLARRGHRSSVYAGWLGDRTPLSAWDDTGEDGLDVRWIATSPWIGWGDDRNWDNPAVTEDFRRHLARIRPEVVHFHSMQSLGAGLVPAARAAGARVVVTMHDFWWVCSRQFLVDQQMRPCSLVADCGVCECGRDAPWRRQRARSLAALLASADLVLAPSGSAARVLAANGVAPGRLEVDENGLPDDLVTALSPAARPARIDDRAAPVRFLYAGGPDPMKGSDVLLDALVRLGHHGPDPTSGWHLTAHGLGGRLGDRPDAVAGLAGLPVVLAEPFDPGDLGTVLAAHDVLVLASVARETHSLLTREALAAGLAVISTDSPGPEEVVVDGVNGLIVPAGDAVALAGALARLRDDRTLLDRLRAGAARPLPARSLDDQVAGLETRFQQLVDGSAPATGPRPRRRSVVFATGIDGAPLRYRARLPAEALAGIGIASRVLHYRHPDLLAEATRADLVVLYRVPATVQILELIEACHGAGIPVAFDVDDLIFDPGLEPEIPALRRLPEDQRALWLQGVQRYRTTLEACDAFIGSTDELVAHATAVSGRPGYRFDNGVGLELARAADAALRRPRLPGPVRIGYFSGTTTHDDDWRSVEPAVADVLDRHRDLELWLGGHLPQTPALDRFGARVVHLPFLDWRDLAGVLRDLDVNLAPLAHGGQFDDAKSAIKWLEAALCATPTVATPTTPFRQAIRDGDTGLLADSTDEWVAALDALVGDPDRRSRLGSRARRQALLHWSPARQAPRYLDVLERIVEAGPAAPRESSWVPVVLDEPPELVVLEPYGDQDEPVPAAAPGPTVLRARLATAGHRVEDLGRRGMVSLRTDGPTRTAGKVAARVRLRLGR